MSFEPVIGLEVHLQLATRSKIFSGASTAYGTAPNTQACAVDLAFPGVLPMLNQEAVNMAILFGLATHATIAPLSVFARKNYFYPDLPKGYQISQYELPVIQGGHVDVVMDEGRTKRVDLTRAHLEEDAGKSIHGDFHGATGIDLNRASIPLLEVVSEPVLYSAQEAVAYLKTLHTLVRYLGICDGNMQEGSFRCDVNVSVRPTGTTTLGTRCEIKNMNSFRYVEKAIHHEIERQSAILKEGGSIRQQTRLYDADRNETRPMRDKEEANDYRYFPDPDLLPLQITREDIEAVRQRMPELPHERLHRYQSTLGLKPYDASVLTADQDLAAFFDAVIALVGPQHAVLAARWISGELSGALNKNSLSITASPISAERLAQLIQRLADDTLSGKGAKMIFEMIWDKDQDIDVLIEDHGLKQVSDEGAIQTLIQEVIAEYPDQVAEYQAGKERLMGFLVGQVIKRSKGAFNPQRVNALMKEALKT